MKTRKLLEILEYHFSQNVAELVETRWRKAAMSASTGLVMREAHPFACSCMSSYRPFTLFHFNSAIPTEPTSLNRTFCT